MVFAGLPTACDSGCRLAAVPNGISGDTTPSATLVAGIAAGLRPVSGRETRADTTAAHSESANDQRRALTTVQSTSRLTAPAVEPTKNLIRPLGSSRW